MPTAFRFAVQSFNAGSSKEWAERARHAEALGYSAMHVADHLLGQGPAMQAASHPPQELAAIPAMCFAAAATTDLKIGCRVFCIDYHVPIVLAKSAMTIDLLSDGRLELGLGAGWIESEYAAVGIPFASPAERVDRLADVVAAMKAFRGGGDMCLDNSSVHWHGFEAMPRPVGTAPIMIGGGGRRVLRLAGREADIVSLNFNNRAGKIAAESVLSSAADETMTQIRWVREGAGERFDEIELEVGAYFTAVTDHPRPVLDRLASMFGCTPDDMRTHPHALIGDVGSICDELQRRREVYGISYVTVTDDNLETFAPVVARLSGT